MIGSSTYNKHLVAVKAANDCEASHARSCCIRSRPIWIARYGLSDNDADYLIRQFRINI